MRGIVKHLDKMNDSEIMGLNLPTGIPFVYELDENMKPIKSMQFLGDEETVRKAMESVANQGKAKKEEPAPSCQNGVFKTSKKYFDLLTLRVPLGCIVINGLTS